MEVLIDRAGAGAKRPTAKFPLPAARRTRARRLAVRYDFSHRNSSAALRHYQSCRSQFGVFRELLSDLLDRFPAELK